MAGGQERVLKRRIRSVQATQKITRAMELIAASQMVKAQNRIAGAAPYQEALASVLADAAADAGGTAGRLVGVPDNPTRVLLLTLVADRGLAGGYNNNVLRTVERMVRSRTDVAWKLVAVGRKAQSFFRFRHLEAQEVFTGFSEKPTFEDARRIAAVVSAPFLDGEVDQVLVCSTRFLSAGTQVVETRQLLPLPEPGTSSSASPGAGSGSKEPGDISGDLPRTSMLFGYVEFEPEAAELLVELVPRYVEAAVFGALLEASASFFTAQQRAMAAATDNAEELVKTLTRVMNRARQDSITTEIMEIVGGAEALRQAASDND